MSLLREELLERYKTTGKIGFVRPSSYAEALHIVDMITETYEEDNKEIIINIKDLTEKLNKFFEMYK